MKHDLLTFVVLALLAWPAGCRTWWK